MLHLKGNSSHKIDNMKEVKRSSNMEQKARGDLFLGKCSVSWAFCPYEHSSLIPSLIYQLLLNAHPISNQVLGDKEMNTTQILSLWNPQPRSSAVSAETHSFLPRTFNECLQWSRHCSRHPGDREKQNRLSPCSQVADILREKGETDSKQTWIGARASS